MVKKKDDNKPKKEKGPRKEIVFDLSDGVTWHDFAGIFVLFLVFIWRIIRLILAPFFWVYGENVRMYRFIRATGHERVMTEDERYFVETLPLVFTLTGITGGIILGILATYGEGGKIEDFFNDLEADFITEFFNAIGTVLRFIIVDVLFALVKGIADGASWLVGEATDLIEADPFVLFLGLTAVGVVVILLWIILHETGVFANVTGFLIKFARWVLGSPERFRFRINNYYRKINHWLAKRLVGEKTLLTRTQIYFKRVVFYTVLASIYSFIMGIVVALDEDFWERTDEPDGAQIVFIAFVLFIAGFISGTIFFGLLARVLDVLNRKKYIASEFIQEGNFDQAKIDKVVQKDRDVRKQREEEAIKAMEAEKPWKKRPEEKKEEAKPEPKPAE
ncbi:MAG: hypothetical protein ACXAB7_06630 [Candidatus Kariarchaeaceae archaeon]|jgi:hypothetical protein